MSSSSLIVASAPGDHHQSTQSVHKRSEPYRHRTRRPPQESSRPCPTASGAYSRITRYKFVKNTRKPIADIEMAAGMPFTSYPISSGQPSSPATSSTAKSSRSKPHPFVNLTFTALHNPSSGVSSEKGGHGTQRTRDQTSTVPFAFGPAGAASKEQAQDSGGVRARNVSFTSDATVITQSPTSHTKRRLSTSVPSSPHTRTRSLSSLSTSSSPRSDYPFPLDPRKQYFFIPSTTPVVLPPSGSTSPRLRKRSGSTKSVPSTPTYGLTPVGSALNIGAAYAGSKPNLHRSPSLGEATYYSQNTQAVPGASTGSFSLSQPPAPRTPTYYSSGEDADDDAPVTILSKRAKALPSTRLHSRRPSGQDVAMIESMSSPAIPLIPLPLAPDDDIANGWATLAPLRCICLLPSIFAISEQLRSIMKTTQDPLGDRICVILWAMATAYHVFSVTSGLLRSWLLRYPAFPSALVRLLAFQAGILWPAIHLTVGYMTGQGGILMAWCAVGTCAAIAHLAFSHSSTTGHPIVSRAEKPISVTQETLAFSLSLDHLAVVLLPSMGVYVLTSWLLLCTRSCS